MIGLCTAGLDCKSHMQSCSPFPMRKRTAARCTYWWCWTMLRFATFDCRTNCIMDGVHTQNCSYYCMHWLWLHICSCDWRGLSHKKAANRHQMWTSCTATILDPNESGTFSLIFAPSGLTMGVTISPAAVASKYTHPEAFWQWKWLLQALEKQGLLLATIEWWTGKQISLESKRVPQRAWVATK